MFLSSHLSVYWINVALSVKLTGEISALFIKKEMNQMDVLSHQLMLIGGILLCVFGLVGNLLNICVFVIWSAGRTTTNPQNRNHTRTSNSPLYLLTASIANLIVIAYGLTTRILFDSYQYQVSLQDVFLLCKLRYYALHTFDLLSLTCVCLATFDRYLVSSRKVRLRQMSATKRGTKFILLFLVIFIGLHSIPIAIYYEVSMNGQCYVNSELYLQYYRYTFQIFLHGIIPILTFSLFGFLTFHQLKTTKNRQNNQQNLNIDKQLSRMLLLMSLTIVLSSIPYTIENIYYLIIREQDELLSSAVFLFHIISSLLFYINPVCSFYVYFISTPNFRSQVRKLLLCKSPFNRLVNNQVNILTVEHHDFS